MCRFASLCLIVLLAWPWTLDSRPAHSSPPRREILRRKARIYFIDLKDGATIPSKVKIRFGIENMEIAPASRKAEYRSSSPSHRHRLPPLDQPIPSDFNHIHFGSGQTEAEITLPAGEHTLQLLLGDHARHSAQSACRVRNIRVRVDAATVEKTRTPAPAGASVSLVEPVDGATVGRNVKVKFGISGMDLAPAGTSKPNTGHHHLLIDTPLPALDREIPSDLNHLHFGRAQTETEITLAPGDHTLQLLLGDHEHFPTIRRSSPRSSASASPNHRRTRPRRPAPKEATKAGRQPSPPDAAVYFVYPTKGESIYPNSTTTFGLRNMGVAPAGIAKPNTGHHHLLIDVETPPLDQPLPSDLNHVHFGNGQTEKKITLSPGKHTLQLVLADERHIPHDPPVISERIEVFVKTVRKRSRRR